MLAFWQYLSIRQVNNCEVKTWQQNQTGYPNEIVKMPFLVKLQGMKLAQKLELLYGWIPTWCGTNTHRGHQKIKQVRKNVDTFRSIHTGSGTPRIGYNPEYNITTVSSELIALKIEVTFLNKNPRLLTISTVKTAK